MSKKSPYKYKVVAEIFWTDPKVRRLNPIHKLIFLYLFTNHHSHYSGIYHLSMESISHDLGISLDEVKKGMDTLSIGYQIKYSCDFEIVWVRNMLKYQRISCKHLVNIANHLKTLHNCPIINDFLTCYKDLGIPYQYPIIYPIDNPEQEQEQEQEHIYTPLTPQGEKSDPINTDKKPKRKTKKKTLATPPTGTARELFDFWNDISRTIGGIPQLGEGMFETAKPTIDIGVAKIAKQKDGSYDWEKGKADSRFGIKALADCITDDKYYWSKAWDIIRFFKQSNAIHTHFLPCHEPYKRLLSREYKNTARYTDPPKPKPEPISENPGVIEHDYETEAIQNLPIIQNLTRHTDALNIMRMILRCIPLFKQEKTPINILGNGKSDTIYFECPTYAHAQITARTRRDGLIKLFADKEFVFVIPDPGQELGDIPIWRQVCKLGEEISES